MVREPDDTMPKHLNALHAINQASIALKLYRAGQWRSVEDIDSIISNLESAYKDVEACRERLVYHAEPATAEPRDGFSRWKRDNGW